jgi:hypothetical protein
MIPPQIELELARHRAADLHRRAARHRVPAASRDRAAPDRRRADRTARRLARLVRVVAGARA